MKKLFTTLFFLLSVIAVGLSQGSVTGTIVDDETDEALIGATLFIKGGDIGTVTDIDGNFRLANIPAGEQTLVVSYTGYATQEIPVTVGSGNVDLGVVRMGFDAIGLKEVSVIASIAVDRRTPVAASTIGSAEIEAKVGNQEFPEVLKTTPSIYATKGGGGFGDSRINVRGFDQRNTAVMINGIPVNDMENGWVYWSNWAGLADVTRTIQVQRGLGASKLAINSVGGTINLITKTTDMNRGGSVFTNVGNDGYLKYGLTLSTGRTEKGWAFTVSGSRTTGNGYVDATYIDAWSYFASIAKELGTDHQLVFTAFGAPQRHGQRSFRSPLNQLVPTDGADANGDGEVTDEEYTDLIASSNAGDFDDRNTIGSIRYNSDWGYLNGEIFNFRENFYHKPQMALNWYWTPSSRTLLTTSAYLSFGRGGGSGDRGSIDGRGYWGFRDGNGLVRVDDIVAWNQGTDGLEGFPDKGNVDNPNYGYVAGERNGLIRRASMNEHNWYGVLSSLNTELTDNLNLIVGVDIRQYEGLHYRRVKDLLGNDIWLDPRDVNNQDVSIDINDDGEIEGWETGGLVEEDPGDFDGTEQSQKINYDNDGIVGWQGGFAQLEYTAGLVNVFIGGSVSNTSYQRVERFLYPIDTDLSTSDRYNFLGYNAKAGGNLNLNEHNNVFVNAGIYSRAPNFDVVFPNFNNEDVFPDAANEKVLAFEAGYGFITNGFKANLNAYYTQWDDKTLFRSYNDLNTGEPFYANIPGLSAVHQGIELEFSSSPFSGFFVNGSMSLGDWEWKNNVEAFISDDNNTIIDTVNVFADGLKVGDAAQFTGYLGVGYEFDFGLNIDFDGFYYDNLYAQFDPAGRTSPDDAGVQALQLPAYMLLNGGLGYTIDISGVTARFRLNVYNILDELYIVETNDASTLAASGGFFGFGRTWSAGVKLEF
ncbi:MAG: TonB-dependent receptor [Bacteroidetes bacterium]|nr:TonB-dependent receptor [Bacteroidota bacterium]